MTLVIMGAYYILAEQLCILLSFLGSGFLLLYIDWASGRWQCATSKQN